MKFQGRILRNFTTNLQVFYKTRLDEYYSIDVKQKLT